MKVNDYNSLVWGVGATIGLCGVVMFGIGGYIQDWKLMISGLGVAVISSLGIVLGRKNSETPLKKNAAAEFAQKEVLYPEPFQGAYTSTKKSSAKWICTAVDAHRTMTSDGTLVDRTRAAVDDGRAIAEQNNEL